MCECFGPLFRFEGTTLARPFGRVLLFLLRFSAVVLVVGCVVFFDILIASTSIFDIPSYEVPTVDALATRTDEGRGWLRKATGSRLPGFDP